MLSPLLSLPPRPLISIAGAGGKTTTMYTLAHELAEQGERVIVTTTTNIFFPKAGETDAFILATETSTLLNTIKALSERYRRITVAAGVTPAGKLTGLQPDQPYELLVKSGVDAVIVEADGARHRMIKAPAEHEPAIPGQTNVALLMLSAAAINQPLSSEIAHRPERIAALLGIQQGDILTPARIAQLMTSKQGGLKNIPPEAKVYLLVTHVSAMQQDVVRELAALILSAPSFSGVCYSPEPETWLAI